jgi:hypothetical protein
VPQQVFVRLQVGVSVGFIRFLAKKEVQELAVEATENVLVSCVAVLLMCAAIITTAICCHFKLPAKFGVFTIGAYCIYVTTCVVVLII